jgi:hypothetical protein
MAERNPCDYDERADAADDPAAVPPDLGPSPDDPARVAAKANGARS